MNRGRAAKRNSEERGSFMPIESVGHIPHQVLPPHDVCRVTAEGNASCAQQNDQSAQSESESPEESPNPEAFCTSILISSLFPAQSIPSILYGEMTTCYAFVHHMYMYCILYRNGNVSRPRHRPHDVPVSLFITLPYHRLIAGRTISRTRTDKPGNLFYEINLGS